MAHFLKHLVSAEEGATMVEYALMLGLIGAALIATVTSLSGAIGNKFTSVSTTLSAS
jgi:pilus assembly protein Flp/PilA